MQTDHTITNFSSLGLLKISGEKASQFLQGQLTCNLQEISPTQTRLGAHCNPQGRIISLFRLFQFQDSFYLQMPRAILPLATAALKKYAVFFKVELSDASDEWIAIGYSGDQLNLPSLPENDNEMAVIENLIIIKIPGISTRFTILGPAQAIKTLTEKLAAVESNVWHYLDIASGMPAIYPETSEKFLPHELNLPKLNGVSFTKGCFTGQEIIARMQYRGKLKTHLYFAKANLASLPTRGGNLYLNAEVCGSIVDYCEVGYNNYVLLILVSDKDALSPLTLDPENTQALEITRLD